MQDRSSSIEMTTLFNEPSLKEEIAQETFEPDASDTEGNFRWFFGFQQTDKTRIPAANRKEKFQFLANMGLLPDNDILSNKLINIYGKRVFSLIHEKSRTVDKNKSFRKKIGLALGLSHLKFNSNNRLDLHVCWMVVKKIRAIQLIDTLLNTSTTDFQENYQAILAAVSTEIQKLEQLIPLQHHAIYTRERAEIEKLSGRVHLLSQQLDAAKKHDVYLRNQIIQHWQRDTFLQFNADFQIHEGHIGLAQLGAPIARENISNSVTHTDAQYAIQEHTYAEWKPVTPAQLWLIDDKTCGYMLCSEPYCTNSLQRKELLLGACLSEELAAKSHTYDFDRIDQIQENNLINARAHYQKVKSDLQKASLKAKTSEITSLFSSIKRLLVPQKIDPETGLPLTSREFSRYIRSIQVQLGGRKKLDDELKSAIDLLNNVMQKQGKDTFLPPAQEKSAPKQEKSTLPYQHAPVPHSAAPLKKNNGLKGTFKFTYNFLIFLDKDLMAKRPYIAACFFNLPSMQFTLPVLAAATSSPFFAQMASAIFTLEANLAKYTGLNLLLQATIHQQITAENLKQATTAVREAIVWFTRTDSVVEQILIGSVIAKLIFNLGDLLLNNPFTNRDAALLSEYWTTLFPEAAGSLEGTTFSESLKNFCIGFFKTIAELGAAAVIVGSLEHFVPLMDILLSPLANVPWDVIAEPSFTTLKGLQTLGVSKAAAFILLKTYGILDQIRAGQLVDIDGYKLRKDSNSLKVLTTFLDLTQCSSQHRKILLAQVDPAAYKLAREHFQELLSQNPNLWELYSYNGNYDNLRELGVKKILPKRRHKYAMAFIETIPAIVNMAIGIVPGIFLSLPILLISAVEKTSPYALLPEMLRPIYRYGIEALNLYVELVKIPWTFGKSIVHPFLSIGARVGEIAVSAILLPFFLAGTALRPFAWLLLKKPFHLDSNPARKFLVKPVLAIHSTVSGWLREHVRYPLEKHFDGILRACRDVFVRKIEREAQVGTTVENPPQVDAEPSSEGSTFDALKALTDLKSKKAAPSTPIKREGNPAIRPDFTVETTRRTHQRSASAPVMRESHPTLLFTTNKVSRSLSCPLVQTEIVTTPHHSRAIARSHG